VRRSTRFLAPVSVGLLAALSIGACSSDSDGEGASEPSVEETTTMVEAGHERLWRDSVLVARRH